MRIGWRSKSPRNLPRGDLHDDGGDVLLRDDVSFVVRHAEM